MSAEGSNGEKARGNFELNERRGKPSLCRSPKSNPGLCDPALISGSYIALVRSVLIYKIAWFSAFKGVMNPKVLSRAIRNGLV